VRPSAQRSVWDRDARRCIQTRKSSIDQTRPLESSAVIAAGIQAPRTPRRKQGCRAAQVPKRSVGSSAETVDTQLLRNILSIQTNALQQAQSPCFNQGISISSFSFSQVINPDEVVIPDSATQESLRAKLRSDKAWIEKITTHLILRGFTSFMEKTVRAVRYLKNTRSFSV